MNTAVIKTYITVDALIFLKFNFGKSCILVKLVMCPALFCFRIKLKLVNRYKYLIIGLYWNGLSTTDSIINPDIVYFCMFSTICILVPLYLVEICLLKFVPTSRYCRLQLFHICSTAVNVKV